MEDFADLLTDAFSESSVPSFSTGDFDFENVCFDEKSEEEQTENLMTESDEAQLQEAFTGGAALLGPSADALNRDENSYEEQIDDENNDEDIGGVSCGSETSEDDDCSGSDGEQKVLCSGKDEEEGGGSSNEDDTLMSTRSSDVPVLKKDDRILDDEDAEILEDPDELKVSSKMHEEVDSDEEGDGCRDEIIVRRSESEEDEQEREEDSSESDYEGMKIEGENVVFEDREKPHTVHPEDSSLEFPSISSQNLQDLISEVDGEIYEEKMSDFTGEEHQEAGESFAEYPSDFSSGEYGKNPVNVQSASPRPREEECLERAVTESQWTQGSEKAGWGKDEDFLSSRDIEMNTVETMNTEEDVRKSEHLLSVTCFDDEEKISISESCRSRDDEEPPRRSGDVFSEKSRAHFLEDDTKLENIKFHGGSSTDDRNIGHDKYDPAEFLRSGLDVLETNTFLSEYLLTADDTDGTESTPLEINQRLDEDVNCYSVLQREDTKPTGPFTLGSIDDSFFFNGEPDNFTEDGQEEEEDEYEERRNFEQMKQRIEAFKKFYDNSDDEKEREERQIKVQFCADPLSQVNYYETDSSDRESISSSSDREEDPSSPEQSDEEDPRSAEQSDEEDPRPAELTDEEDPRPAEQSDEEDPRPTEQSDEEDPRPTELSDEEDPRSAELTDEEDPRPAEQSDEEDPRPTEQSDEEDPRSAEQSDEEDPRPTELSDEEDPRSAEQSDEEDPSSPEQSDEEDPSSPEQSDEEDPRPSEQSDEEDPIPVKQSDDRVDVLSLAELSDDGEKDPSSPEQSDEPREPEENLKVKPVCDAPGAQQHQYPADTVNTQSCGETRKSLRTLKLIVSLGVLTATGLMMFYLTTDQPEWLRQFLFF